MRSLATSPVFLRPMPVRFGTYAVLGITQGGRWSWRYLRVGEAHFLLN